MKLLNQITLIIVLFTQFYQNQYYCKNDSTILNSITKVEKSYVGQGSFGVIRGDGTHVSKTMKTDDSESMYLLNNELKVMIAYNTEHDFAQLHPDNCWYKYNNRMYHYEVKAKMDQMKGDLKSSLKSSSLKSRTIWKIDIIFKILAGLKKLHDYGILHLDLKEANIMMMNDYTPIMADFGMSLLKNERRTWVGGTPLFMSPEVKRGQYSKGADIFALGIIFFQLLNERFVSDQSFRKLCNYRETVYTNAYCLFDESINKMLDKYNASSRPSVDDLLIKTLGVLKIYMKDNHGSYEDYMDTEQRSYNSSSANPVTKSNKQVLNQKWEQRKAIYDAVGNNASTSQLRQMIDDYAKPAKDINKFFRENSQRDGIVGYNQKQIKDQNQLVDAEEDQQRSRRNIIKRMEDAQNERDNYLQGEKFFRREDIVDKAIDLPKIQLGKKAPSNNIEFRKKQILNEPRFNVNLQNMERDFLKPREEFVMNNFEKQKQNNLNKFGKNGFIQEPSRAQDQPQQKVQERVPNRVHIPGFNWEDEDRKINKFNQNFAKRGVSDPNQAFGRKPTNNLNRFDIIKKNPVHDFQRINNQRVDHVGALLGGNDRVFNKAEHVDVARRGHQDTDQMGGNGFIQRLEQQRNQARQQQNGNNAKFKFNNRVFV